MNQLDRSLARLQTVFQADRHDCMTAHPSAGLSTNRRSDPVHHPAHYAQGWSHGAEVIDIAEHLGFCRGNAVKYLARAGRKSAATELEDLRKARWYVDREIARLEGEL